MYEILNTIKGESIEKNKWHYQTICDNNQGHVVAWSFDNN